MRINTTVLLCLCLALTIVASIVAVVVVVSRRRAALAGEEMELVPMPSASPSSSRVPAATPSVRPRRPTATPTRRPQPECLLTHTDARRVTDSHGRVCAPQQVLPATNCCPEQATRYVCVGCDGRCCREYEHCVSCCMQQPGRSFQRCAAECRSSSASLDAHGHYAAAEHHCWGGAKPPRPSVSPTPSGRPIRWLNLAPRAA